MATFDATAVAALLGDATRARMLGLLMDGRAFTATELAVAGEVAASTASSHLERMVRGGLLSVLRQGRHRYYRLTGPDVAAAVESLDALAPPAATRRGYGPVDAALRHARVCYDHLAGTLGVQLLSDLCRSGRLGIDSGSLAPTAHGARWLRGLGIEPEALRAQRRPLCRTCLDWSERRDHLAGALGAALLERMLALGYLRRRTGTRALGVTAAGAAFFARG